MSTFYASTFYADGYRDGYEAVFADRDVKASPPDEGSIGAEYMQGWRDGLKAGRDDYWGQKQEQSWHDWQAGL